MDIIHNILSGKVDPLEVNKLIKDKKIWNKLYKLGIRKSYCLYLYGKGFIKRDNKKIFEKYFNEYCSGRYIEDICKEFNCTPAVLKKIFESFGMKKNRKDIVRDATKKSKETRVKIYNNGNYRNSKKAKQTCIKIYGVEHPMQSKEIKDKTRQTNIKKHGVDYFLQSQKTRDKIKQTNLERYGVENPLQSKKIRDRIKKTNLERYGVENPFQVKEIKEKIKETNTDRYGTENPLRSKKIRDKIKKTNLKRYGVENPFQSSEIGKKILDNSITKIENEILKLIKDIDPGVITNYKSNLYPFFCDFYLPKFDLYIEFQGFWTHGSKPYNGKNLDESWVKKAEKLNIYKSAIEIYTKCDPLKRKIALENKLNFLEIWFSDYLKGNDYIVSLLKKKIYITNT